MHRTIGFALLAGVIFLGAGASTTLWADLVIAGQQKQVSRSDSVQDVPIAFYLDLTGIDDGAAIELYDFSVKVNLIGSNAGADVAIASATGTTSDEYPQAALLGFMSVTPGVPFGTEAYGATVNVLEPFAVDDQDGLMEVVLRVQPNVIGSYEIQLVTGAEQDTYFTDRSNQPVAFKPVSGLLTIAVPEPSAGYLVGLLALGFVGARCVRWQWSRKIRNHQDTN